ncbi:MAG: glycoside hydrolase family 3 N-terminal domain-containing protein [Lapillicoccus sp.]
MSRRSALAALTLVALGTLAACTTSGPADGGGTTTPASLLASPSGTTPTAAPGTTTTTPAATCGRRLLATLSLEQKVGQLVMVGAEYRLDANELDPVLRDQKAGGIVLLGTWIGAPAVGAATQHWQPVGRAASGGIGLLVAADQEGGQVRHLRGAGFTATPSALSQGRAGTAGPTATTVAGDLKAVGVNVDLAPVADTVAASFAAQNAPIGAYQREYGNDPATVARSVVAAVGGLQNGGVSATLKHFPGLGRVTGNTDLTPNRTTDSTTTADDPYLEPFRAGIHAGAELVMVSSAIYSTIDPANRAAFSPPIVTGLLREKLSYAGVVISDDLGGALAVASIPAANRATRFVAAGGDVVLTGIPLTVPTMVGALRDKARVEPAFAAQVDAATTRVLDLKARRGLADC